MSKSQRVPFSAERRVILVFVLSALAGIVLVGGTLWFFLQRATLAQCRTYLESRADMLARQCESEIAEARQDLKFMSKMPAFQQLPYVDRIDLSLNGVPENVDVEKRQFLAQIMNKAERFSVLYVLRPNADIYVLEPFELQPKLTKHNLADRPYYQEAVRTKDVAVSDGFLGADGILAVVILVPILAESGEVTGYLGGAFHLTGLSQLVSKERVMPFDAGFIVDRQGYLIAHTDTKLLQEGVRERFIKHPLVSRFRSSKGDPAEKDQAAIFLDDCVDPMDAKHYLAAYVPLRSGWGLGLMRNRDSVIAEVRPVVWGITALASLLLVVISGLGVSIAHGIGQRWHGAERALRASEERFRIVAESISDVIYEWDLKDKIDWYGDVDGLLGYPTGGFPRTLDGWAAALHPEDKERAWAAVGSQLKGAAPYDIEYRIADQGGGWQWWSARGNLLRDEWGEPKRWLGAVTDITERKRAEEEIRNLNAELEERVIQRTSLLEAANKELEAFTYSVSHDLRAPLRHISGYVDLLTDRCKDALPDKGKHYLDSIADSTRQMGLLIDDLLQFSRTGRIDMRQSDLDMNQALQEALRPLQQDNASRAIEWIIGLLPSVYGNHAMLRLVWANLLDNAVKYTRRREKARIEVGVRQENREIVFFVRDNGVGFDMKYAHKLFGVFQRLHPTEEFEGTGIGLANVRRIILRHGGRTWAEAELDQGATFYFSIPKRKENR